MRPKFLSKRALSEHTFVALQWAARQGAPAYVPEPIMEPRKFAGVYDRMLTVGARSSAHEVVSPIVWQERNSVPFDMIPKRPAPKRFKPWGRT